MKVQKFLFWRMTGLVVGPTQVNLRSRVTTHFVDFNGTFLLDDMLYENFWSGFCRDWRSPVISGAALSRGRVSLKRRLAAASVVEIRTLSYPPKVIAFVEAWHRSGDQTAPVKASDRDFAKATSAGLGRSLFVLGEHTSSDELPPKQAGTPFEIKPRRKLSVPFDGPSFARNQSCVRKFNALYYRAGTLRVVNRGDGSTNPPDHRAERKENLI
ncbi:MAG: hypothetical protein KUG69_13830 [Marinosulfonomonas sp.]|nr:hypothetical protein [Marinosulfonomonas sp.]